MAYHIPVLLAEVLDALALGPDARLVDGTVGDGGHSVAIMEALRGEGKLLGIDLDQKALDVAATRLAPWKKNVTLARGNFRDMARIVEETQFGHPTGILLDLGIRSAEIEESGLGFSFLRDEPLVMRLDGSMEQPNAASLVNSLSEQELTALLHAYGEEPFAPRIAHAIVTARREERILRSSQLADIVRRAVPAGSRHGRTHVATKTFQALRIAVNEELESLTSILETATTLLADGGALAVISFHSLEDRIVKRAFQDFVARDLGTLPFKKPIIPTDTECAANPRSRSAKLRVFRRSYAPSR